MIKASLLWQVGLIANFKLHFYQKCVEVLDVFFVARYSDIINTFIHIMMDIDNLPSKNCYT